MPKKIHILMEILRGLVQFGNCTVVVDKRIKRLDCSFLVPSFDFQIFAITKLASNSTLGWPESEF